MPDTDAFIAEMDAANRRQARLHQERQAMREKLLQCGAPAEDLDRKSIGLMLEASVDGYPPGLIMGFTPERAAELVASGAVSWVNNEHLRPPRWLIDAMGMEEAIKGLRGEQREQAERDLARRTELEAMAEEDAKEPAPTEPPPAEPPAPVEPTPAVEPVAVEPPPPAPAEPPVTTPPASPKRRRG